jgi:DnaJ-like protein
VTRPAHAARALPFGRVTRDPYRTLGIEPTASSEELHDAYRRLVKLHHPDRNGGSPEATRRFQDIQAAYEEIGRLRAGRPAATQPRPEDDSIAARMADLEREIRETHAARAAAREAEAARAAAERAARDAIRRGQPGRPSDEELGYVTTDDSFGKILSDIADEITGNLSEARHKHPAAQRLSDLLDRLHED